MLDKKVVVIATISTFILQILVMIDYTIHLRKQKSTHKKLKYSNMKEILYYLFSTEYYLKNN